MRPMKSVTHTKTKTRAHDDASSSSSDQATAYSQQEHARPRSKWENGLSPTSSGSSASMTKRSLNSSISKFRSDFDELKCKMKIFGESLNLCRCIAHDFKLKLNKMEKRLESLEKRQGVRRQHSHYTAIIQKNKRLSHITLADAQKLKLCKTEPERCEVAARICRNYLSGAWKTVDPQSLLFKRISGGLSNIIYYISLPDGIVLGESTIRTSTASALSIEPRDQRLSSIFSNAQQSNSISAGVKEPREVLLRIYGQVHGERAMDAIVTESVIFTLLSERRLGPKLHGVFSGGRIEEYIPARSLRTKEMSDPAISMKIAEKMAAIHSMNVPLGKEPTWLWTSLTKWLRTVREEKMLQAFRPKNDEEKRIIDELDHEDLSREIDWLKKYLNTFNSPAVFCHNDMQEGNILIVEDTPMSIHPLTLGEQELLLSVDQPSVHVQTQNSVHKESSNEECDSIFSNTYNPIEPQLYLIDFEYCAYNYRGFDIANHFEEWLFDYTNQEYPFYHIMETNVATADQKDTFIKRYLKEYLANIYDDQDPCMPSEEEISQLRAEVEAFALASHLLWSLWSFVNANKSQIPFGYWEYGYVRLDRYKKLKLKLEAVNHSVAK